MIESPKIATYDKKPEMSAYEVSKTVLQELDNETHNLIVVNIANGDMVGHTGIWNACIEAVKVVDECTRMIVEKTLEKNGTVLIFSDHGNIEDQSIEWRTSHTINPVQFILISNEKRIKNAKLKKNKGLQDIAPTVLKLLDIKKPKEMTGKSIF